MIQFECATCGRMTQADKNDITTVCESCDSEVNTPWGDINYVEIGE